MEEIELVELVERVDGAEEVVYVEVVQYTLLLGHQKQPVKLQFLPCSFFASSTNDNENLILEVSPHGIHGTITTLECWYSNLHVFFTPA